MYTIDPEKLNHAMWDLIGRVLTAQAGQSAHPTKVTFDSGWFRAQEWYKRTVWEKAQEILQWETWKEENIHTSNLAERIAQCMDIKTESGRRHNLLDWRETAKDGEHSLKKLIFEKKEQSEIAIFQIFRGDDEGRAFEDAIALWGRRSPFLSFLFYLKDIRRFVPVRPGLMKARFETLGIKTDCLDGCTWENYREYLQIMGEVQDILRERLDPAAELIDAHSFVWAIWLLNEADADALPLQFEEIEEEINRKGITGEDREAVVRARVNQSVFRELLLKRYKKCCLCGVSNPELLVASHIRPWKASNRSEKVDVDNGLLLCPTHDRLFDKGLITFADDGSIRISEQLSSTDRQLTGVMDGMRVPLTSGNKEFMEYHRANVYRGKST